MKYNFDEIIDRNNTNCVKYGVGRMMYPGLPNEYVPMWIADMDFACPEPVLEAMKARLDKKILGYSMILDPEYYQALGTWMKERHDWDVDPQTSLYSGGVIAALDAAVEKLTSPADGVLLNTPAYHPFDDAIKKHGRTPVYSRLINNGGHYEIDWTDFEEKAKDPANTLYFLCNPHNPTGRVWTRDELIRIGEICFANGVFVVSDEIHFDFIRSGQKHTVFASLFPEEKRVITCTAPSKTFNLAGCHLSNIFFADPSISQQWMADQTLGQPNPLSIEACKAAYSQCADWVDEMNLYLDANFQHMAERFAAEIPSIHFTIPEATYLAWVDVSSCGITRQELALRLVAAGLQVEFEDEFVDNGDGHIRMNLACPRQTLDTAIDCLVKAVGPEAPAGVKRLYVGQPLPDLDAVPASGGKTTLHQLAGGKKTMFLFLRYSGCPLCQLDMHELKEHYAFIEETGGQLIVILQSDPAKLAAQLDLSGGLPYPVICDPDRTLYQALAVFPAVSQMDLMGPKLMDKMALVALQGISHGEYEGDEMQLPAAFAVDERNILIYVHYGQGLGDTPDAAEIANILK